MAFPLPLRRYGPSPFPAQKSSLGVGPGLRPGVNELAHLHRCQPLIGAGGLHLVVGAAGSSSDHYAARIVADQIQLSGSSSDHYAARIVADQIQLSGSSSDHYAARIVADQIQLSGSSSDHYAARIVAELALPLFVTRIGTDHHNPPVPTDQPALVTDRLDARVYLHDCLGPVLWVCRYLYRYTMRPRDRS